MWMIEEPSRPKVISAVNIALAVLLHLGMFLFFWCYAVFHGLFNKQETVIPIDLTVIVNENLDGKEDEPPPLVNPVKPTPPPKPKPKVKEPPKKIEEPKPLEQIVIEKKPVKKEEKKPDPPKKETPKKEPPKPEPPKPEPPKKTKEEILKERIARMRAGTKKVKIEVKDAKKSGDGKTARQTLSQAEILKRLNAGYTPGTTEQLASNEMQLCLSLVQKAINSKWDDLSPKIGRPGTVHITVRFNSAGGFVGARITKSCGDAISDRAALDVVSHVTSIPGLTADFKAKYSREPLTIVYDVRAR